MIKSSLVDRYPYVLPAVAREEIYPLRMKTKKMPDYKHSPESLESDIKALLDEQCVAMRGFECRTMGCFLWAGWTPEMGHEALKNYTATCPARELALRAGLMTNHPPSPEWTCVHGRAADVHCCECGRGGFILDSMNCVCF